MAMKISQSKNYKKPLYALGVSTAVLALSVTGCTDPIKYAGDVAVNTTETEEVELGGEAVIESNVPDYSKYDADNQPVALAGEVDMTPPETTSE